MNVTDRNQSEYNSVDVLYIIKNLWGRAWIIILSGILCAAVAFCFAAFLIAPKYSSSIMLYVNNSSFSLGNTSFSISSSEITAAQSLVKTYRELLINRTTLERVIEKTDAPYTYKELAKLIEAAPSNETEIMKVTVTTEDPYEAARIANCIAEVLPVRISEIIDGASMEVVDSAVPELDKVAPSITQFTAIGLLIGLVLSVSVLVVNIIFDDTINDEEYILQTYKHPILAKVPNLVNPGAGSYQYYYR